MSPKGFQTLGTWMNKIEYACYEGHLVWEEKKTFHFGYITFEMVAGNPDRNAQLEIIN